MNPKKQIINILTIFGVLFAIAPLTAKEVEISSIAELAEYAGKSGNTVKMEPGSYQMTDYIPLDQIPEKRKNQDWLFLEFSGDNNVFDLTDVTIEFDTELRVGLDPPRHMPDFAISGGNNTLKGLTIRNIGDGTSKQGCVLSVRGDGNTLRDLTLFVRGSFPYGYGDLLGKGPGQFLLGRDKLRKKSGLQITGSNIRLIGCRIYMRSFGHAFYLQEDASDVYFEDCYAEGEMRSTDDMLAETSGPAYEADFANVYHKFGPDKIPPGYMTSLAEGGFRHYSGIQNVTYKNCTSKNMRSGFSVAGKNIKLINCTAVGNEAGFILTSGNEVINSRGDAKYGPLLYLMGGENSRVELALMPAESDWKNPAVATLSGSGHRVSISPWEGKNRSLELPIYLGIGRGAAAKTISDLGSIGNNQAQNIELINATTMPVIVTEDAADSQVYTRGEVLKNNGRNVDIFTLNGTDAWRKIHSRIMKNSE